MENNSDQYIAQLKYKFDDLYEKLLFIHTESRKDYENLREVVSVVSSEDLNSNSGRTKVQSILSSIEHKVKTYNNDLYVYGRYITDFELEASNSISLVTGKLSNMGKNILYQSSNDQVLTLKEGLKQSKEIISTILKLIEDIKSEMGVTGVDDLRLRELCHSIIKDELEVFKKCIKDGNNPSVCANSIMIETDKKLNQKFEKCEKDYSSIKSYIDKAISNLSSEISNLNSAVRSVRTDGQRSQLTENVTKITEDVLNLRLDIMQKLKIFEKCINDNSIKRYN
jgi:hypothetical protein